MRGAFLGARRRDACRASPVLLPPHQTTGVLENRMNTALESRLLARNGRSTALEVYGVEPNTLTRYFFGAAERTALINSGILSSYRKCIINIFFFYQLAFLFFFCSTIAAARKRYSTRVAVLPGEYLQLSVVDLQQMRRLSALGRL